LPRQQLGRLCLSRVAFERRLDAMLFACGVGVVALASVLLVLARGGSTVRGRRRDGAARRGLATCRSVGDAAGLFRWIRSGAGGSWVARTRPDVRHDRRGALAYSAIAARSRNRSDALWYTSGFRTNALAHGRLTDPPGEYIGLYPGRLGVAEQRGHGPGRTGRGRLLHFACLPLVALAACAVARCTAPRR
jgi:hypothetical protein